MDCVKVFLENTSQSYVEVSWQHGGKVVLTGSFFEDVLKVKSIGVKIYGVLTHESSSLEEYVEVQPITAVDGSIMFVLEKSLTSIYCVKGSKSKCVENIVFVDSADSNADAKNRPCEHDSASNADSVELLGNRSKMVDNLFKHSTAERILNGGKDGTLRKLLSVCEKNLRVIELPLEFDGNISFELPGLDHVANAWDGMQQKYDGHLWTKPVTSNAIFDGKVRKSICAGLFECPNQNCGGRAKSGLPNRLHFSGQVFKICPQFSECAGRYGSLKCFYCQFVPICIVLCTSMIYYLIPANPRETRLVIHSGLHDHPVRTGVSRQRLQSIRKKVTEILQVDRGARPRKIQMEIARDLITTSVTGGDEMTDVDIARIAKEFQPLVMQGGFRRMVHLAKRDLCPPTDSLDSLLNLKRNCRYDFFHSMLFPGQGGDLDRCHVFKMSTKGDASGVDLVVRMNREGSGDLRRAWIMFDHTHRVNGWVTMAAHVYDPNLQELLTIATCEMKEEDEKAQVIFWEKVNTVVMKDKNSKPNFHGFMADEAQANWRAIRKVYNEGYEMHGRERSCLFHWEQSLKIHTEKYVVKEYRKRHVELCETWRKATSKETAILIYRQIRTWWSTGKVRDNDLQYMDSWMSWWNLRISHWGSLMSSIVNVDNVEEQARTPRTNLAESMHGSWLAGEGQRKKISLYDAAVTDLANAILQTTKQISFNEGRHIGRGPSLQDLIDRVFCRMGSTPQPKFVNRVVQHAVSGTNMQENPHMQGNNTTFRRKRGSGNVEGVTDYDSHRPEYTTHTRTHEVRGQRKKVAPKECPNNTNASQQDENEALTQNGRRIAERNVNNALWAIRRLPPGSKVRCMGWLEGKGRCDKKLTGGDKGKPAPCFFGMLQYNTWKKGQFVYFCNDNVQHTWNPYRSIQAIPGMAPGTWPVAIGTHLTKEEIEDLEMAGFDVETEMVVPMASPQTQEYTRQGRYRPHVSREALKRIESAANMTARVVSATIMRPKEHELFEIETTHSRIEGHSYTVTVSTTPSCTCPDFMFHSVGGGTFLACKHMYFVYMRVFGLDQNHSMYIHQPTMSKIEVFRVLSRTRLL